jgi:hypothetical protein
METGRGFTYVGAIVVAFALALLLPSGTLATTGEQAAGAPAVITYQGYLVDSAGDPIDDQVDIRIGVYAASSGGSALWEEAHSNVDVANGYFTIYLGNLTALDAGLFDATERWLQVSVDSGDGYDDLPRQQVTSVPYALQAEKAASAPWAGLTGVPVYASRWPTWGEVTGKPSTFSPESHTHAWGDVTGVPAYTIRWATWSEVTGKPSTFPPESHTHDTRYYTESELSTSGGGGQVHWDNLAGVPAGFADGADDTGLSRPGFVTTALDTDIVKASISTIIGSDGLPVISYVKSSALYVIHCNDIACTTSASTAVTSAASFGEQRTSITIGADGYPVVSFYTSDNRLGVAFCDDVACSTSSTTSFSYGGVNGGMISSIAIGTDGYPIIGSSWEMDYLRVFHCNDADCTTATNTLVDSQFNAGSTANVSIDIGADGLPVIAYTARASKMSRTRLAHCSNVACTSSTINDVVVAPSSSEYRTNPSLTIGSDGLPIIAYRQYDLATRNGYGVAHCDDLTCASVTATTIILGLSSLDLTAITVGSDGMPIIFSHYYTGPSDSYLMATHCSNLSCTRFTSLRVGDWNGNGIAAIGIDGMPFVVAADWTGSSWNLTSVHCSNVFCTPYYRRR